MLSTKHFKVDQKQSSDFDEMISENCLNKIIDNDSFIYIEGRPNQNKNFLSKAEKNRVNFKAH